MDGSPSQLVREALNLQSMNPDFLIIGEGMVGFTLARELKNHYPDQQVLVIEKRARSRSPCKWA